MLFIVSKAIITKSSGISCNNGQTWKQFTFKIMQIMFLYQLKFKSSLYSRQISNMIPARVQYKKWNQRGSSPKQLTDLWQTGK